MTGKHTRTFVITTTPTGGDTLADSVKGGDHNACNVDDSGAANPPYRHIGG